MLIKLTDESPVIREQVDATKGMFRKKREKLQKFEYKLVQSETAEPVAPKVLPKVPLAKVSYILFLYYPQYPVLAVLQFGSFTLFSWEKESRNRSVATTAYQNIQK